MLTGTFFSQKHAIKRCGLALIVTSLMLVGSCLHAAALDEAVRPLLAERLTSRAANSSIKETAIPSANVRAIVHDNLDPSVLTGVVKIRGTDFKLIRSGQQSQFAILILTYHDEKTARRMGSKLSKLGGYFKHTKILTRFSCAPIGNELALAFTENAGSEELVKFIGELPLLLREMAG